MRTLPLHPHLDPAAPEKARLGRGGQRPAPLPPAMASVGGHTLGMNFLTYSCTTRYPDPGPESGFLCCPKRLSNHQRI